VEAFPYFSELYMHDRLPGRREKGARAGSEKHRHCVGLRMSKCRLYPKKKMEGRRETSPVSGRGIQ